MTELPSQDQLFIQKLTEIVEANISREDFDVEQLARESNMSRSALHRRLSNLGRLNASHFIRDFRLQRARELLHNGFETAAEVSYRVGFGSPTYFSKCFHEYYGHPPGEERKHPVKIEQDGAGPEQSGSGDPEPVRAGGLTMRKKSVAFAAIFLAVFSILLVTAMIRSGKSKDMSIVVLPFRNLSSDIENQYFADGIMEDILNSLSQNSSMRVVSRTTSEQFRNSNLTAGEISRRLDVRNVLEGSVRREGDRVRITIQLIDGQKERHIWSEAYDRLLVDMLGIQDEIARKVTTKLSDGTKGDAARQGINYQPADPRAFD
jgi:TolB-like protein/AraC-like DNA-binding protein